MTTPTLPPEIAAAMQEAPYSVENLGQYIDHFVIQYFGPERTVIPDIPAVFYYESDAEELAQELNFELRQHRVAVLITEREKALVEALREIKLLALTAGAPGKFPVARALSRITRLCIDAGVTDKLDALEKAGVR